MLQRRKPIEPLRRLQNNLEGRLYMFLVEDATTTNRGLIRKRSHRFQAPLNRHQAEFFAEIIRVDRFQSLASPRVQKEQTMRANLSQRRRFRLSIQQQRNQIIARRSHARILMIDYANPAFAIDQEIGTVIIAMA